MLARLRQKGIKATAEDSLTVLASDHRRQPGDPVTIILPPQR
ncbi:conserved protein of unknown function [Magnetospirillum sp. XM-1]|nr:hypothetical protein [Magnetospirillum sp. XM-1]CUW41174.1 conserved protein of unknown function [Magnetospirillum sp. XM-1]